MPEVGFECLFAYLIKISVRKISGHNREEVLRGQRGLHDKKRSSNQREQQR
jgi:hypothetical protein